MSSESVGSCGDGDEGGRGRGRKGRNYENAPEERGNSPRGSRGAGEGSPGPSDRRAAAAATDGGDFPAVVCACGRGTCAVLVSRTERNPGRPFFRCPAKLMSERCKFFLWCDMAGPNQQQNARNSSPANPDERRGINNPAKPVATSPTKHVQLNGRSKPMTPICACGAGRCSILTMQNGVNTGRKYYACVIKKGQGACSHFQWLDETAGKPPETGTADLNELERASPDPVLKDGDNIGEKNEIDDPTLMQLPLESPPVSPTRQQQANDEVRTSPMKRLDLRGGGAPSASGIGKCYRCGREGHWMAECASLPVNPCFGCGKPGHWMKDCPEFRQP